jgi:hypothetical protein
VNIIYDNGAVYLTFDLPDAADVSISVYSLLGENIFSEDVYHIQNYRVKLAMGNNPSGVYIAVAHMMDVVISKKFLLMDR